MSESDETQGYQSNLLDAAMRHVDALDYISNDNRRAAGESFMAGARWFRDQMVNGFRVEGGRAGWVYGPINCSACRDLTHDYWFDADEKPYCEAHAFAIPRKGLPW